VARAGARSASGVKRESAGCRARRRCRQAMTRRTSSPIRVGICSPLACCEASVSLRVWRSKATCGSRQANAPGRGSDRGRPHPHSLHHQKERPRAVSRYVSAGAWRGAPRLPAADAPPAACASGRRGPGWQPARPDRCHPGKEPVGLLLFLRGHPPRVRQSCPPGS
jgi:hypothetical protein